MPVRSSRSSRARSSPPIYEQTLDLRTRVASKHTRCDRSKTSLAVRTRRKDRPVSIRAHRLLGLDLIAFRTNETTRKAAAFRGGSADETPRSVSPGESSRCASTPRRPHPRHNSMKVWLESRTGDAWKKRTTSGAIDPAAPDADPIFNVQGARKRRAHAALTSRAPPSSSHTTTSPPEWRERSFAPYPLAAWAEFTFDGLPIRVGQVVQTLERVPGRAASMSRWWSRPPSACASSPRRAFCRSTAARLPVRVTVHTQAAAEGTVELEAAGGLAMPSRLRRSSIVTAPAIPSRFSSP